MSNFFFKVCTGLSLVSSICSCGSKNSSDVPQAVQNGKYTVSAPVCLSTGAKPNYPAIEFPVAIFDFELLTSRSWNVSDSEVSTTYTDEDCTAVLTRKVHSNSAGIFSFTQEKKFTFTPDGCEFTVSAAGQSGQVSKALSKALQDSSDGGEEIPYRVDSVSGTYQLTTLGQAPFRTAWSAYGCSSPDALVITLSK